MELQNKNDYTCIVFYQDTKAPFKMAYTHNCYSLSKWLNNSKQHQNWLYFNIYARRTMRYIKRAYKNSFIEAKPK